MALVAPVVAAFVFSWAVWRHVGAARASSGAARVFWGLIAVLNVVVGLSMGVGAVQSASMSGPYEASAFVTVCSVVWAVLTAAAFGVLAFARTPLARRGRLLDLVILLVGGAALGFALIGKVVPHDDFVSSVTPFAFLQVVALAWMLQLPGRRPRALVCLMVGVALMSVVAIVTALSPMLAAEHPPLFGLIAVGILAGFVCWARAAGDASAPSVADRADDMVEEFGHSRLVLFGAALLMLPVTLIVSSVLGGVNLGAVVFSSSALAALVVLRFRSMFRSVQQSKADLAVQEKLFRSVVESVHDMILMSDRSGAVIYRSPAASRAFGDVDANVIAAKVDPEDAGKMRGLVEQASSSPGVMVTSDVRIDFGLEGWRCFDLAVSDLGGVMGHEAILWSLHDVTDRSRLEGELRHQALHDSLTGLPNRVLAADRIGTAAGRSRRSGAELAVLFLDLDNFKHINDSLGHAAGDELLRVVAERLTDTVREVDTVARLGGDEFVVIVEAVADPEEVTVLAERIRSVLREPIELAGGRVSITASVGIALGAPGHAGDLLRHADVAMYEAKAAGKDFVVRFTDGMANEGTSRLHLEMDLIDAIDNGDQLVVHYQPIVGLADQQIVGAEALVRWQHPVLGLLPPVQFVPIAEEIGLIGDIGRYVLHAACHHAAAVQHDTPGFTISVNVSARQLENGTLCSDVETALLDSGLPAELLILEITESTIVRNVPAATHQLQQIRTLGARIAIDDFGTGFSSVSALRDLPIDILKIDRSFIAGMLQSAEGTSLVHALIEMGRSLNLWTVAEGVEQEDERDALIAENCDAAQGFLFGRPQAHTTPTTPAELAT